MNTIDTNPVCQIKLKPDSSPRQIEAEITIAGKEYPIFIRSDYDVLHPNPEAFLAGALLPAMVRGGGKIVVPENLPSQFPEQFFIIQAIYSTWNPDFHQVDLDSYSTVEDLPATGNRVGLFFSGGADSLHSLYQNKDKITDLIYIRGNDIPLSQTAYSKRVMPHIAAVADHFEKNLIVVDTNVRTLLDDYVTYGKWGFSPILSVVGLSLYPVFKSLMASFNFLPGFGIESGTLLLPLWNNPVLSFQLVDSLVSRVDKIAFLADSEIARNHLRVCYRQPETRLNCGQCEKCIRTMLALEAYGVLGQFETFPPELDRERLKSFVFFNQNKKAYFSENLRAMVQNDGDPAIIRAMETSLSRPKWHTWLIKLSHRIRKRLRLDNSRQTGFVGREE